MLEYIWLVVLFPFLGFIVIGLLGRKYISRRWIGYLACGVVFLSLLLSIYSYIELRGDLSGYEGLSGVEVVEERRSVQVELYEWLPSIQLLGKEFKVGMSFHIDPLSCLMILMVTGVGFLIHVYSIGYMWEESGYFRYFSFLNLFMGMMLTLVLAGNFLLMFVGWEGVGLCSYLLIGFFYEEGWRADAGRKAFIVNRIGDFGFLIGMLLIVLMFGTLNIQEVMGGVLRGEVGGAVLVTIGLLLFIGAIGKSAQIPLYVWLPDAMAGPTPVSALIHAATMVTAGVYMVSRCGILYMHAPLALGVVAIVGALTALFAASIGLMQNDIKKVLAYSTVSQLGYMFLGAGVAAFGAAIFHLMTHAFFKALLFLGSGSVIHGMGGEQDIRRMGGLRKYMPVTFWTFLLGALAIVGIPGFSGFFSKDEILFKSYLWDKSLWVMGVLGAGLTAFYMLRLVYLTFYGEGRYRKEEVHVHESPRVMTVPLIILAVLSVVGGYVGIPKVLSLGQDINYVEHFLEPVFVQEQASIESNRERAVEADQLGVEGVMEHGEGTKMLHISGGVGSLHGTTEEGHHEVGYGVEILLMVIAVLGALFAIYVAWQMYRRRPEIPKKLAERYKGFYQLIVNKYWVDELYDAVIVRPYYWLCRRSRDFDTWVVDGTVNGIRHLTVGLSHISNFNDKWFVDGMVNLIGYGIKGSSWVFRKVQTGIVQNYAAAIILGTFILLSIFLIFL